MKILVIGATGAIGAQLLPQLTAAGHDVVGVTSRREHAETVRRLGAEPAVADVRDPEAVALAVSRAAPEVVIHQATALSGGFDLRHLDRTFALTNRLRTEGTDHLLSAARAAGVRRFIAQSYAGWPFGAGAARAHTEDEPLADDPLPALRTTLAAIEHLERAVVGATWTEGIVLRYGAFYGPGTSIGLHPRPGEQVELVRARRIPIVGGGRGVWSFVHVADAAAATVAAVTAGGRGILHVADDDPAPVSEWLPALAAAVGAKPPRRVPRWAGRLVAGLAAVFMMDDMSGGVSNAKAKRELGWQPRYPSWRQGFVAGLRAQPSPARVGA